ncbi:MAG: nuclear transport factor 2 family protein [Propionibacteriales bacterium]|nr:nuclear transport factor 2 family protein [Propionibacteriales bacterium]
MADTERQAITDLLIRYGWAIDSKDWELLRGCFTADCAVSYGNGASPHPDGVARFDNVDALVAYMARTHDPLDGCLHRMSNISIEVTGRDTASARVYGDNILVLKTHPDGPVYQSAGYYTDELVKQDGEWRIAARRYTRVWAQGNSKVVQPDS